MPELPLIPDVPTKPAQTVVRIIIEFDDGLAVELVPTRDAWGVRKRDRE